MKIIFLALAIFIITPVVVSQTYEIDSLKTLIYSDIADSSKINHYLQLAESYENMEYDSAKYFANKALSIAQKNNFQFDILRSYLVIGYALIIEAEYQEALTFITKALDISKQLIKKNEPNNNIYKKSQSKIYLRLGHIYYYQGNYDLAIQVFFNAVKLLEEVGDEHGAGTCLSNISVVYESLNNYKKAIEYNYKALSIAKENNDLELLAHISNNLAVDYIRIDLTDSAYYYISKSIRINEAEGNESTLRTNYINLGRVFYLMDVNDSALYYLNKSLKICNKTNNIVGLIDVNYLMGEVYLDKKDYPRSEKHFKKSLNLAEEAGIANSVKNATDLLSDVYKAKGDYKKAYEYFVSGSLLTDSIFFEERESRIAEIETKYQTQKKEEQIKLLKQEKELQTVQSRINKIVFASIIIILILIIVLVIITFRSYKHKQLAERRKMQQNAEHKILDAIIETEYKERKRFAEDLHDGLGVLLSTTRLYINEIEDSTAGERKILIKQSNTMLDDAIANARNISNNIMPAALKNNGLEIAIKSFCDKVNTSGNIKIKVQSVNFKKHHKNTIEITLYRILTEMINNTLKHANASEVNIILIRKDNGIFVTYEDNGIGFDYEKVVNSNKKGMGLNNLISRIKSIGGSCSIKSKAGKGFYASIEVTDKN